MNRPPPAALSAPTKYALKPPFQLLFGQIRKVFWETCTPEHLCAPEGSQTPARRRVGPPAPDRGPGGTVASLIAYLPFCPLATRDGSMRDGYLCGGDSGDNIRVGGYRAKNRSRRICHRPSCVLRSSRIFHLSSSSNFELHLPPSLLRASE